jgi:two-component system, NtrC family, response regulator HydG
MPKHSNLRRLPPIPRRSTIDQYGLIGSSPAIAVVRDEIARFAPTSVTVLICGETGTGKELVARALHGNSPRRGHPFIAANCAAFVDSLLEAELFGIEDRTATGVQGRAGKFELADNGTLFLDEVSDLSGHAQAALLRVLEDFTIERVGGHCSRRVDTRVIVASNSSLEDLVVRRRFRADLFYRVRDIKICLPSLRERLSDIPLLTAHFLEMLGGGDRTLTPDAMDAFLRYPWPGNVRELKGAVRRCLAWSSDKEIGLEALAFDDRQGQPGSPSAGPHDRSMRTYEAAYAQTVLEECGGNKLLACRRLDIDYKTLQSYIGNAASPSPRRVARVKNG